MRTSNSVAVLLLGIIVGCAAERVLTVPPAHAGTTPQRWEYACIDGLQPDPVAKAANQFGQQGWEMVTASGAWANYAPTWCFKRPLP
jgi:hypothetical protein